MWIKLCFLWRKSRELLEERRGRAGWGRWRLGQRYHSFMGIFALKSWIEKEYNATDVNFLNSLSLQTLKRPATNPGGLEFANKITIWVEDISIYQNFWYIMATKAPLKPPIFTGRQAGLII
jgi:hypothetical protein